MPFNRRKIDKDIDNMIAQARKSGATNEAMFLVDAPLREFIVAVEQMRSEGADVNEICDASVMLTGAMITNLAKIFDARDDKLISFCNTYLYEVGSVIARVVNAVSKDELGKYVVNALDPNRTEH
jgi:hypothetical protein